MTIHELVDYVTLKISKEIVQPNFNLKSILFQLAQAAMSDAYQRGIEAGKAQERLNLSQSDSK